MSNVELVQRVYAAFGRGDIPAVLAAFDAQIEWREAEGNPYEPSGQAWVGFTSGNIHHLSLMYLSTRRDARPLSGAQLPLGEKAQN